MPFGKPEPDTTKEWAQVVYTAWQLMSQTEKTQLTEVEEVSRDRAGLKRDRRDEISNYLRLSRERAGQRKFGRSGT